MVDTKKIMDRFEAVYQEEKNRECEDLHNAIADLLAEKKASIQNTLYVLEIIRFELLRAKYEQILGHAIVPDGGGLVKGAKFQVGEAKPPSA